MLSKKGKILIVTGILCVLLALTYSEYRTKSFIHTFIADPEQLEEKVERITIYEQRLETNVSIATLNSGEEQFEDVLLALKDWKVKKLFYSEDLDPVKQTYLINMTNDDKPIYKDSFELIITKEGIMSVNGREYKLVSGNSLEEIMTMME